MRVCFAVKTIRKPVIRKAGIPNEKVSVLRWPSLVKSLKILPFQERRLPRVTNHPGFFGKFFHKIWHFMRLKYQESVLDFWLLVFFIKKRDEKRLFLPITDIRQMSFGFSISRRQAGMIYKTNCTYRVGVLKLIQKIRHDFISEERKELR